MKQNKKNRVLLCGLIMDEMSIRKHVEWNGTKNIGYVDLGTDIESDALPVAKEALVFLLVGLNMRWKIPIAYFLLNGLAAAEKANLVKGCLKMVYDCGVKIVSFTFDGTSTNLLVGSILGAKLEYPDIQPWFLHPLSNERIHILLDACHMVKLVRNTLGDWKRLQDADGKTICWNYFEKLVSLQEAAGLHAANKLSKRHLNFRKEIMKVKLAVQVFSASVADAFDFCDKDLHLHDFENVEATSKFCRMLNNIFDLLNSRNFLSKSIWGKPLSLANETAFRIFLNEAQQYISSLKDINGCNILKTRRKCGFLGLLICMISVKNLFDDVIKTNKYMSYLLTYKLSQDHIEMFFSAIRSRGGFNNNPTASQFRGAYKRLLVHTEINTSLAANCIAQDDTSVLTVSSASKPKVDDLLDENYDIIESDPFFETTDIVPNGFSEYVDDVTEYIAGFVARKVARVITCGVCADGLLINDSNSLLLNRKNRGGLCKAATDVVKICKIAEKVFRMFRVDSNAQVKRMILYTFRQINGNNFFVELNQHILDQDPENNHILQLLNIVLKVYFTLRMHYVNKNKNEFSVRIRHIHTKLIQFNNQ